MTAELAEPNTREDWGPERSRTVTWNEPGPSTAKGLTMAGVDYLRAMAGGELPQPPIAGLMRFEIVSADPGRVVFTCQPDESAYNPIGAVHGGLVCTLLDSVTGCAVHSTLPQGKGYTSVEIKVNYLKAVRLNSGAAHRDRHCGEDRFAGRLRRGRHHRCQRCGGRHGHEHDAGVRPVKPRDRGATFDEWRNSSSLSSARVSRVWRRPSRCSAAATTSPSSRPAPTPRAGRESASGPMRWRHWITSASVTRSERRAAA